MQYWQLWLKNVTEFLLETVQKKIIWNVHGIKTKIINERKEANQNKLIWIFGEETTEYI